MKNQLENHSRQKNRIEREGLLNENMGLVVSLAQSFKPRCSLELDEYIQSGRIGLWKAINKHDPKKGALSTIAWYYIRWEIIRNMPNCSSKKKVSVKLFTDLCSNFSKIVDNKNDTEILSELMPESLTDKERTVLCLRAKRYTMREIGESFSHSRGWANETFKSAVEKVRNAR